MELPLWFLLLSLLLPRVSLIIAYFADSLIAFNLGWGSLILGVLIPRVLVLFLIYHGHGMSIWLLVHLIAMVVVFIAFISSP